MSATTAAPAASPPRPGARTMRALCIHAGPRARAWLAREGLLDARCQLVHATHSVPAEVDGVAACGAGVVLCPGTEANLSREMLEDQD